MEKIKLSIASPIPMTLDEALLMRESARGEVPNGPLSLQDAGNLFGHALMKRLTVDRRPYPSGGALFPIETYLLCAELSGAKSGAYHYDPTTHTLEYLWNLPSDLNFLDHLIMAGKPDNFEFTSLLVFTSLWQRSSVKYGDFAYVLALLEAGHISQNVLLTSVALGIAARPMGGFDDEKIAQLLDIDTEREQIAHVITLGRPSA